MIRTVHLHSRLKTRMESTPILRDRVNIVEHPIIRLTSSRIQDKVRRLLTAMVKRQQPPTRTTISRSFPLLQVWSLKKRSPTMTSRYGRNLFDKWYGHNNQNTKQKRTSFAPYDHYVYRKLQIHVHYHNTSQDSRLRFPARHLQIQS